MVVDNALRAAVGAYPTLMLILFLAAGLAAGVGMSCMAATEEEEEKKRMWKKRRLRRWRAKKYGEPEPPDWWGNKPWWRWK